jgi:tetratricopeptide (TPR) repeat protein
MVSTYKEIINEYPSKSDILKDSQLEWLKNRNKCNSDYQEKDSFSSCVKYLYNKRIEQLEGYLPGKQNETESRGSYRQGNKEYQAGNYFLSVKYYNEAYENSDNYVDKVRALGAIAINSKEQGNLLLASKYAKRILEIDSTSEKASEIVKIYEESRNEHERESASYVQSSNSSSSSSSNQKCMGVCLIKALGTEACGAGIKEVAKESLDASAYDFITSPACEMTVAKIMGEEATDEDIAVAAVAGLFNSIGKSGLDSDNAFYKILGGLAKGSAIALKISSIGACMDRCN